MRRTFLQRLVLVCLVVFSALAVCAPEDDNTWSALDKALQKTTRQNAVETVSEYRDTEDKDFRQLVKALENTKTEAAFQRLRAYVSILAQNEDLSIASGVAAELKRIKANPLYGDAGVKQDSNWLQRALDQLKRLRLNWPKMNGPNINPGLFQFTSVLTYLMWGVLAVLVAVFAFFLIKHLRWRHGLARKVRTLMEEDEPSRTADEWLALADENTAKGEYRAAIRGLYLACLLRFDEAKVARFDRSQTNWEHLKRIDASPRLPAGMSFLQETQIFDRIWYGNQVRGLSDVTDFRARYVEIVKRLREVDP
jgi:hypothetical protein